MVKKQEGFKGQRSVILPGMVTEEIKRYPLGKQLYITDIGFYPEARYHFRKRKHGCNQYILIYCIGGRGWISVNGREYAVEKNMYFIIPQGVSHSYGSADSDPWTIYWVHFAGEMAKYFYDISGKTGMITPSAISRIDDRIQLFEEMMVNLEMGYSRENIEYANVCLLHFLSSFKYITQFRQVRRVREEDWIERSILFMKSNLAEKLTLSGIAKEVKLSASHFSLLFRKKTGYSPMEYFIHLRIQKACQLLDSTTYRVSEISEMAGYDDQYYFSRIFKKVMGVSPVNYRKEPKG
jgi:AraC-like DNA-binding protein/quercetin dioxygenase-like cupin family protein